MDTGNKELTSKEHKDVEDIKMDLLGEAVVQAENNTAINRLQDLMRKAWTYTQSSIEAYLEEMEKTVEKEENMETPKVETLPREDEEHFVGFGTQSPGLQTGAAKLNFLQTMKRHSAEYKELAVSFRRGNNNLLRAVWKRNYLASESRLDAGESETGSEVSSALGQNIDFDVTPTTRITRSKGLPLKLDYVQRKTLEYKPYNKKQK